MLNVCDLNYVNTFNDESDMLFEVKCLENDNLDKTI